MKLTLPKHFRAYLPIAILLLINLVVGLVIVRDYGESWDEPGIYSHTNSSIQAYAWLLGKGKFPDFSNEHLDYYGPAYSMVQEILTRILQSIFPSWSSIDGWHFGYFLAFQVGILSLYFLARKSMSQWAALGTTVLFSTQPVLWGHAFINPKDIPFMGFFLASVTLGFYMVDEILVSRIESPEPPGRLQPWTMKEDWRNASSRSKKSVIVFCIILLVLIIFTITGLSKKLIAGLVSYIYHLDKGSFLGAWFTRIALNANRLPVGNYITKAQIISSWVEIGLILPGVVIGIWGFYKLFPHSIERIQRAIPLVVRETVLNPYVLAAGAVLGFTISIRILGPLAGGIVMLYAFYKSWRKALILLIPYSLVSLLIMYLTWPYLWGHPVSHFIESFTLMASFPWNYSVLFRGALIPAANLPKYFIPYMMSIQLTEVIPPLFILGLLLSIWHAFRSDQKELLVLILIWFFLPLGGVIAYGSTVYDNFRQFLFLLPPVFLAAGIVLEALFTRVKGNVFRLLILSVLVIPGIFADIQLHPYQYIYYNSYVDGVRGAFRNYELDYWETSYRQAAQYVNQTAPLNEGGIILGQTRTFQDYARSDLRLNLLSNIKPSSHDDFLVINTRLNEDLSLCQSINPVMTVSIEGVILAEVKELTSSNSQCLDSYLEPK
jgi:hypothetical protein